MITPEELAEALRVRFEATDLGRQLRVREIASAPGAVCVIFDGYLPGGPYGARVEIPADENDPRWTEWSPADMQEWIEHAGFMRIMEAHDTRSVASREDGITWLDLNA